MLDQIILISRLFVEIMVLCGVRTSPQPEAGRESINQEVEIFRLVHLGEDDKRLAS